MYTAKIKEKAQNPENRQWYVIVEFSNGTDTFLEKVYPQDQAGFDYWLEGRLASLNGLKELIEADNLDVVIYPKTITEPTQAEKDRTLWLQRDAIKEQVDRAIAKGYLTGTEPKVVQLNSWLKTNFKPEYLNLV